MICFSVLIFFDLYKQKTPHFAGCAIAWCFVKRKNSPISSFYIKKHLPHAKIKAVIFYCFK